MITDRRTRDKLVLLLRSWGEDGRTFRRNVQQFEASEKPAPGEETAVIPPSASRKNVFKKAGAFWVAEYEGLGRSELPNWMALFDVHHLLAKQGETVPIEDLPGSEGFQAKMKDVGVATWADGRDLVHKIVALKEEQAQEHNALIWEENDKMIADLNRQYNENFDKNGKPRQLTGDFSRLVQSTQKRFHRLIKDLEHRNVPLARHLEAFVSIDKVCSYQPERPVHWDLD